MKFLPNIFTIHGTKRKRLLPGIAVCFFLLCSLIPKQDRKPEPFLLKYPSNFGGRFEIPANNLTTKEGVALGRKLFYEKKLSANGQQSCESCHKQKLAFTDGKAFSEGGDRSLTARSSMSLANLLWVRNFFWDGRAKSLEEQAIFPLTDAHEMGQSMKVSVARLQNTSVYPVMFKHAFGSDSIVPEMIVMAISQFERTLISADSPYDQYLAGKYKPTQQELNGMALFMDGPAPEKKTRGANCGHCHGGPKTFKELFHNNGLDSVSKDQGRQKFTGLSDDHGRFRVPTLRNIALTAPYMHDGRFTTLEQVLDHYNEHIKESPTLSSFLKNVSNEPDGKSLLLTKTEKTDIVSFLHMLTDTAFVNNPDFSNPNTKSQ